jgi:hypothetical protein
VNFDNKVDAYFCTEITQNHLLVSYNLRFNKKYGDIMSIMIKMLKSDNAETEKRNIAKIKKEIEFLTEDLQQREMILLKHRGGAEQ